MNVRDAAAWLTLITMLLLLVLIVLDHPGAEVGAGIACATSLIITTFVPDRWKVGRSNIITDEEEDE